MRPLSLLRADFMPRGERRNGSLVAPTLYLPLFKCPLRWTSNQPTLPQSDDFDTGREETARQLAVGNAVEPSVCRDAVDELEEYEQRTSAPSGSLAQGF